MLNDRKRRTGRTEVGTCRREFSSEPDRSAAQRLVLAIAAVLTVLLGALPAQASLSVTVVDQNGAPISGGFKWLLEEDNTPEFVPGVHSLDVPTVLFHKSHAPVLDTGEATTNPATIPIVYPGRRQFLSLVANGYSINGRPIAAGQTSVTVVVNSLPVPTARISVYVFQDNNPLNIAPDFGAEGGLGGFRIRIYDQADEMTTDAFGNLLGTTYVRDVDGNPVLDAEGNPIVDQVGLGYYTTDGDGEVIVENLAPGKYAVEAFPTDALPWVQTTTIEGTPEIDAWVRSNEPKLFLEFGYILWHVFIGFSLPQELPPSPEGTATITGQLVENHWFRPPLAPGINPGFPVKDGWVALNDLNNVDKLVYFAPVDEVTGEFVIENVPPGTYQICSLDLQLDTLIDFRLIQVPPAGGVIDIGKIAYPRWFGTLRGRVFYDDDDDGLFDPAAGEQGLPDQEVLIRFRDGSVKYSTITDQEGKYNLPEIFPFFKWIVAEVDFGRYQLTGVHAKVDAGGPLDPDSDGDGLDEIPILEEYVERYTDPEIGGESGPLIIRALNLFAGQYNELNWGKTDYDPATPSHNGGVSGTVTYGTTRAENNPRYAAVEEWEPGIPGVQINLFEICGRALDGKPIPCATPLATVFSDSWDENLPTGCPGLDPAVGGADHAELVANHDCAEIMATWNQIRPGVYDGGWAIENLPPGRYVVEMVVPPGYEVIKEEDKNVDFGDSFVPQPTARERELDARGRSGGGATQLQFDAQAPDTFGTLVLPAPCVGPEHPLPEFLADGETPNPSNFPYNPLRTSPLCTHREILARPGQNTALEYHLFTEVPKAGRIHGTVTDDVHAEANPGSFKKGEKVGVAWIPVTARDWKGHIIAKVYTDEWGEFEVLLPSTNTINPPMPTGVSPNVVQVVLNDPIDALNPDPFYNPTYMTVSYNQDVWPGKTTYSDLPTLPSSGNLGGTLDCEYPDGVPVVSHLDGPNGPWVPALPVPRQITLKSDSSGGHGFGPFVAGASKVMADNTSLTIVSWDDETLVAQLPADMSGRTQLLVTRGDNGRTSPIGITIHAQGATYSPTLRRVGPTQTYPTIQAAVDAAGDHDLVLVDPGVYAENLIVWKPVKLQGFGHGATQILSLRTLTTDEQVQYANRIEALVNAGEVDAVPGQDLDPLAGHGENFTAPVVLLLADAGSHIPTDPAIIDGATIKGAFFGSGVLINAFTDSVRLSNLRIVGNRGNFGGGIRVGQPTVLDALGGYASFENNRLWIHHNQILHNGGIDGGGGIALFNGSNDYTVNDNWICGNFSLQYGGGIEHFGLSESGLIEQNTILFNEAFDEGGGIIIAGELPRPPGPDDPQPAPAGPLTPGSGSVTIDGNVIVGNLGNDDGGGIRLLQPNGKDVQQFPGHPEQWHQVRIYNNKIVRNVSADDGGGISLFNAARVEIVHNTVAWNDSTGTAVDRFPANGIGSADSTPAPAGIATRPHDGLLQQTFGAGFEQTFSNPVLVNNIVYKNESYHWENAPGTVTGGSLVLDGTWDLGVFETPGPAFFNPQNCLLTEPYAAGSGNVVGDPRFLDEVNNTFHATSAGYDVATFITVAFEPLALLDDCHIGIDSAALNAALGIPGRAAELNVDYDTNPRPGAASPADADIGADEVPAGGSQTCNVPIENQGMSENFEPYASGANPTNWVDTGANNSMTPADNFQVFALAGSGNVFRTTSAASDIHSHYVGPDSSQWNSYTYTGRLRITTTGASIGATVLSNYPSTDAYYVLRRTPTLPTFRLAAHGTSVSGGPNTAVSPAINTWYKFKIQVTVTGTQTQVRAKVWLQTASEPVNWQATVTDSSATRRTSGRVGVWSSGTGTKYWDDVTVAGAFTACGDSDGCTEEICDGTVCLLGTPVLCDDGNACTANVCNPANASCSHPPLDCDDANTCTTDGCNPADGCTYANNTNSCSDGSLCTTGDTCSNGACGGEPLDCDDGNACTVDGCDPIGGCIHTMIVCSDDNLCTTDACNPADGACSFDNNTHPCSDGDACTTGDICSEGACTSGSSTSCDDGNGCTDDGCNPASGCTYANNTSPCSDGNLCTTGDICSGGSCAATPVVCNDGNVCTSDSCNPGTGGCEVVNNTAPCSDGNACTTGDVCSAGACASGGPTSCADGNPCTDDSCIPPSGCVYANNTNSCDDGNPDTSGDICSGGVCAGVSALCGTLLDESFEAYASGSNPASWFDTGANNSLSPVDNFQVFDFSGQKVLRTLSISSDIHSHYVTAASASWTNYTVTGRLWISTTSASIGVTVLSNYPSSDVYYVLRRTPTLPSFRLAAHGTTTTGGSNTAFSPIINTWYRFKIQVTDTGTQTEIRAKVWAQSSSEPASWQATVTDTSATRRTVGRVGVWSSGSGTKYWDDFLVVGPPCAGPPPPAAAEDAGPSRAVPRDGRQPADKPRRVQQAGGK